MIRHLINLLVGHIDGARLTGATSSALKTAKPEPVFNEAPPVLCHTRAILFCHQD
jgi:hypothetical protein